ncbi:MAG TPA: hypothetical protein PLI13_04880 [Paracoccus sp. (in: a-proteobacteria)]|nr:hypothetical protein [Paracoccus sp. (in: a-proteobacteria)]
MTIFLAIAAAVVLRMILRVLNVHTDPRTDIRMASGWWIGPVAVCAVALILWVLT